MLGLLRQTPMAAFVVVAMAASVACGGGADGPAEPRDSPTAASTATQAVAPTATLSSEEEVSQAYLRYWDAYGDALLDLDASLVEGVADGEELNRIREEIEGLRSQGVALRVVVEHNVAIIDTSTDTATLVDEIVNNSFYVDAETKEPPQASGSGEVLRDTFFLERINGQWMVVRSSRQR